jgi:hypothetical protein
MEWNADFGIGALPYVHGQRFPGECRVTRRCLDEAALEGPAAQTFERLPEHLLRVRILRGAH